MKNFSKKISYLFVYCEKKCITFAMLAMKLVALSLTGNNTEKANYLHNTRKEFLYFAVVGIMQCAKLKKETIPKTIKLINNEKKNFYIITYRDDGGDIVCWMSKE